MRDRLAEAPAQVPRGGRCGAGKDAAKDVLRGGVRGDTGQADRADTGQTDRADQADRADRGRGPEPALVVRGRPTDQELAAVVVALATARARAGARAAARAGAAPARSRWVHHARPGAFLRAGLPADRGPDRWRASALPV